MSSDEARLAPVLWKFLGLIAFIVAATWGVHELRGALNLTIMPENEQQVHRAVMLGSFVFVVLLAFPFVPGAEIGVALLAAFGASIAPLVYGGTVLAMVLAYAVGRVLPMEALVRFLRLLRLRKAAELVERAVPLSGEERIEMLMEGAPSRVVALGVRNRYLAMALAVNTPGNSIIGGGGGIMMMAGLSGIFAPLPTFLTIAIAVSPVPLAVMFLGLTL